MPETSVASQTGAALNTLLLTLCFYAVLAAAGYFAVVPGTVTAPEAIKDGYGSEFYVAAVQAGRGGNQREMVFRSLDALAQGEPGGATLSFLLPADKVRIHGMSELSAHLLKAEGKSQLVEFRYNGSVVSSSVYRAYRNKIEPVEYRVHSSLNQIYALIIAILPAYLLALAVRRVKRTA